MFAQVSTGSCCDRYFGKILRQNVQLAEITSYGRQCWRNGHREAADKDKKTSR